jgi:hypothetical protein
MDFGFALVRRSPMSGGIDTLRFWSLRTRFKGEYDVVFPEPFVDICLAFFAVDDGFLGTPSLLDDSMEKCPAIWQDRW